MTDAVLDDIVGGGASFGINYNDVAAGDLTHRLVIDIKFSVIDVIAEIYGLSLFDICVYQLFSFHTCIGMFAILHIGTVAAFKNDRYGESVAETVIADGRGKYERKRASAKKREICWLKFVRHMFLPRYF